MRLTPRSLGALGHLGPTSKVYGMYSFALSPYELKAFKGFGKGLVNMVNRYLRDRWFLYAPQAMIVYGVYHWGKAENDRLSRKDPKKFENDT